MPFPQKKVKRNTCGLCNQSAPFQDTNEPRGDGPCDNNGSLAGQEPDISYPDDIWPYLSEEDLDDDMGYMDDPEIDDEMCRSGLKSEHSCSQWSLVMIHKMKTGFHQSYGTVKQRSGLVLPKPHRKLNPIEMYSAGAGASTTIDKH
ncbi:hypothetical protein P691DRAFT_815589 [Macrolepiota fuliginosa MF-IS2]|uniref:Uncharacterized protein n=1 Tax=Macrolepiota fuliginosa MF-IS2 TaxID=1400762 RepID=A0A9P5WYT0_9AGAR|nr:hypothetical protein P691DRAFT_815589 [Macrolepiota fuliginosa MF-IS2]